MGSKRMFGVRLSSSHNLPINSAVLGALVGDCATMPLHWIYDNAKLSDSIDNSDKNLSEFNPTPSCPFYDSKQFPGHYKVGQPSPYGEQLIGMYNAIIQEKGNNIIIDGDWYAKEYKKWLTTYGGRKDSVAKAFEKKYDEGERYPECGIDDNQAMSLYKAVIASEVGNIDLNAFVMFLQNNAMALASAEFLLAFLKTISSSNLELNDIFNQLKNEAPKILNEHLIFLEDNLHLNTSEFLTAWGEEFRPGAESYIPITCHNPQALLRILHICLRASSFEEGIRTNILVGGDNASTAIGIGAILGKLFGVPKSWVKMSQF